ncbi:MAG: TlpA family protein disulfide reductase [Verrucomicrobiales bacterium]|nr:TlpA family protein disulfide reductase [Verrucomicrobiales bacterium]
MIRSTHRLIATFAYAALLVTVSACSTGDAPPPRNLDRQPAPEFSLRTISGQTLDRAALKGQIVIVNFWAVWSPACAREIPELIQLRDSLGKNRERVTVIGVCLENDSLRDLNDFIGQLGVNYPVAVQENQFTDQFGGIDAIPTTFVIDPDWHIVNRYTGKVQIKELRDELQYMLDEIHAAEQAAREKK